MRVVNNDSILKGLKYMIRYEKYKLSKGIHYRIIGLLQFFLFIYLIPLLCKKYLWTYIDTVTNKKFHLFVGFFVVHIFFHTMANIVYFILYILKIPFFEKFRINDKPWPWEKKSKEEWNKLFKKTIKVILLDHYLYFPIAVFIFTQFNCKCKFSLQEFPNTNEIFIHLLVLMLIDDFYNYWIHRLFHYKWLYTLIHKKHHEYIIPLAINAEYAHPIEFIFLNMAAPTLGIIFFGSNIHFMTVLLWVLIKSVEPVNVHSGYEFPWDAFKCLPFSTPAEYHDYHHTHNIGNFSSFFTFWDITLSSGIQFVEYLENKEEKRRKMAEKGNKQIK